MNKVILMGRLTRDPEVRYSQGETALAIARYTLAVDRRFARRGEGNNNEQTADFISCVAFGRNAEFAEKYLRQGTKIAATGRIQTGSYTNKDGQRVYSTEEEVEEQDIKELRKKKKNKKKQKARQQQRITVADLHRHNRLHQLWMQVMVS